jgi:hypothetical protein
MSVKNDDGIHLCPICHVVEMEFVERIPSNHYYRLRRFKCPVCDHKEMYIMNGPNDKETEYQNRQQLKQEKRKNNNYHDRN